MTPIHSGQAEVVKKIKIHHGATLSGRNWICVCGELLNLPQQNGLNGPGQKEIVDAWAKHLALRLAKVKR